MPRSSQEINNALREVLAELWRDCYRGGSAPPEQQRRMFKQRLDSIIQETIETKGLVSVDG